MNGIKSNLHSCFIKLISWSNLKVRKIWLYVRNISHFDYKNNIAVDGVINNKNITILYMPKTAHSDHRNGTQSTEPSRNNI